MVRELVEQTCRRKAVAVPVRLLGNFGRMSDERGTIAMEINNFKDMYLAELQELVSVENQLADALLRMAGAATHPALKDLLIHHRAETEIQKQRLVTIMQKHGPDAEANTHQALQPLHKQQKK